MLCRCATLGCLALFLTQGHDAPAFQQGRRGPSASQIKAMQNQMAYMQLEVVRFQAETAQKQEELYKSFDQDGDGKLTGAEKTRFDKHVRDIQTGKAPNPFAMIQPVGKGPKPRSPTDELKKRGSAYLTAFHAKQREIFNTYDENGNGELEGVEKAKYDKFVRDVEAGRIPNPFATLAAPSASKPGK
ncbi:MAG: hypothetical protein ACKOSQ_11155 [Planctomycetaceae bacterium]